MNRMTTFVFKCRTCPTMWRLESRRPELRAACNHCGKVAKGAPAKTTDAKCDSRCTNARGPKCECECGGHNHGAGNAA